MPNAYRAPVSDEEALRRYQLAQAARLIRFVRESGIVTDADYRAALTNPPNLNTILDEHGKIVPEAQDF